MLDGVVEINKDFADKYSVLENITDARQRFDTEIRILDESYDVVFGLCNVMKIDIVNVESNYFVFHVVLENNRHCYFKITPTLKLIVDYFGKED